MLQKKTNGSVDIIVLIARRLMDVVQKHWEKTKRIGFSVSLHRRHTLQVLQIFDKRDEFM